MNRQISVLFSILILLVLSNGCQRWGDNSGFDDGHEWIMPRPASEIHLLIVDEENQPIGDATIWIYLGDQTIQTVDRFVNYDPENGNQSDSSGEVILYFLGDEGGGYEILMDSPGPPSIKVQIEASGYKNSIINIDNIVFVSKYRTGQTEKEFDGELVEMNIVEYVAILEEE